jgi:hypothetical protein
MFKSRAERIAIVSARKYYWFVRAKRAKIFLVVARAAREMKADRRERMYRAREMKADRRTNV